MHAVLWSDYICPWCYLARDRTELMRSLGLTVTPRPFELHPQLPDEGRPVRPGGRLDQVLTMIGSECASLGIPFTKPTRTPRSRRALETAEVVRLHQPASFDAFDAALFRTHWVDGGDLADRATIERLLVDADADLPLVHEMVADGIGARALDDSIAEARSVGVVATPAWWVGDRLLIPGAQPREAIERWITKLLEVERAGTATRT